MLKIGTDTIEAKKHYIKNGKLEGRKLNLQPKLYLENNCDLQLSLGDDEEAALKHFIKVGYFEGRTYSNNLNFSKKFNLKLNDLRLKLNSF